jgi:hypothetical protein
LEKTPPFHKWYFETVSKRTFGFLMEDGYVYFTILDEGFGKRGLLQFLENLRDEFKKIAKKGSRGSFSSMNSAHVQEQLVPVIRHLITSMEHVSDKVDLSPSPSNINGTDVANSTKAPLLGKPSKHKKKKKTKDHVISVRDTELEERRKSTDRGAKADSTIFVSSNQGGTDPSNSLQKDLGSMRMRSLRRKWWRQVWIVLSIDAVVCLVLFVIWLSICHGLECTR